MKTDGGCFFNHETHETHEKIQKIRECSVLTVSVFFVWFVVKKADGLRTPSGKYTVGDSFLEITLTLNP